MPWLHPSNKPSTSSTSCKKKLPSTRPSLRHRVSPRVERHVRFTTARRKRYTSRPATIESQSSFQQCSGKRRTGSSARSSCKNSSMPGGELYRTHHKCCSATSHLSSCKASLASAHPPMAKLATSHSVGLRSSVCISRLIVIVLFPRHLTQARRAEVISHIQTFRDYFHYHIKASKAFIHSRMRKRTADFLQGMLDMCSNYEDQANKVQCFAEPDQRPRRRSARRRVVGHSRSRHERMRGMVARGWLIASWSIRRNRSTNCSNNDHTPLVHMKHDSNAYQYCTVI